MLNAGGDSVKFDLIPLKSHTIEKIAIDVDLNIPEILLKTSEILNFKKLKVNGDIHLDVLNEPYLDLKVDGVMVLPCAITLEPVDYPFSFEIHDNLNKLLAEMDQKIKNSENSIDVLPIIWENILMEIPLRVVSDKAKDLKLEGDGWKLITARDEDEEINPELAKLKDLL